MKMTNERTHIVFAYRAHTVRLSLSLILSLSFLFLSFLFLSSLSCFELLYINIRTYYVTYERMFWLVLSFFRNVYKREVRKFAIFAMCVFNDWFWCWMTTFEFETLYVCLYVRCLNNSVHWFWLSDYETFGENES